LCVGICGRAALAVRLAFVLYHCFGEAEVLGQQTLKLTPVFFFACTPLLQTTCDTPLTFLPTTKGNIRERIMEEIMMFNGAGEHGGAGAGAGAH
jgi:hypothetical protein